MKDVESYVEGVGYEKTDILRIYRWSTAASHYREEVSGSARIKRITYDEGVYFMEGVAGYDLFQVMKPIKITLLEIKNDDWHTVMLDDPLHDYGMKGLALSCSGDVLVAGLGLGLIIHYLNKNINVTSIDVVENNRDIISLVKKYINNYDDVSLWLSDYIKFIHKAAKKGYEYDYAVLDLWSWNEEASEEERKAQANQMYQYASQTSWIAKHVYVWGVRDPDINPAVRKIISSSTITTLGKLYSRF